MTSIPSGATAVLERSQSKTTPGVFYQYPVGKHEDRGPLWGYQPITSVNVVKGKTATINIMFTPLFRQGLSISSNPSGAAVYVDGLYRGVTATTIGNLAPGQHVVLLSKAGYQDWQGYANIQSGVITTLSPTLVSDPSPIYGTVSIKSTPSGASVYADGVYVGQTSPERALVFTQVKPGYHEQPTQRPGYGGLNTSVGLWRP